jgi:hypothetical protein
MLKELLKEILKEELVEFKKPVSNSKNLNERYYGRIVMVRTYSAGVHFGELVEKVGQEAILKNSRRVWYWTKACSLSQLAMEGSQNIDECKISMPVDEILLDRVIEVIPMSAVAIKQLSEAKEWKK